MESKKRPEGDSKAFPYALGDRGVLVDIDGEVSEWVPKPSMTTLDFVRGVMRNSEYGYSEFIRWLRDNGEKVEEESIREEFIDFEGSVNRLLEE